MRIHWATSVGLTATVVVMSGSAPGRPIVTAATDTVVVQWNQALLQAVRTTRFAPMLAARALAVTHTCMYDAWAAYDPVADGVHWPVSLRQPIGEHTDANKVEAISFAAHAALVDLFPSRTPLFDSLLSSLGYSLPGPAGSVGLTACHAVLDFRHVDGSNQLGDLHSGAYSDYTDYAPYNTVDTIYDPNRWQPLVTAAGSQQFLAPHWGLVTPFALTSLEAVRPAPPPRYPHGTYIQEANQILHLSAKLDDRAKMIAEYWADGPASVTPPGHWNVFAQAVSRRDAHGLDADVKMFFALGNALLDASIAVWDCKRFFDFARPISAIRFLYGGQPVRAWAGPGRGTTLIDGKPVPQLHPDATVSGVRVGSQRVQRRQCRDPRRLHRQRIPGALGDLRARQFQHRARDHPHYNGDAVMGDLPGSRGRSCPVAASGRHSFPKR